MLKSLTVKLLLIILSLSVFLCGCKGGLGVLRSESNTADIFYLDEHENTSVIQGDDSFVSNKGKNFKSSSNKTNTSYGISSNDKNSSSKLSKSSKPVTTSSKMVENSTSTDIISGEPQNRGVHLLTNRNVTEYEKKVINNFKNATGIEVKVTITSETEYTSKLISLIKDNDAPNVVLSTYNEFLKNKSRYYAPLNKTVLSIVDGVLDTEYMKAFSFNNNFYGIAAKSSWLCLDKSYITYYNKKILEECNITTTPYKLYMEGKWNWENQRNILYKIKSAQKDYRGMSLQNYDLYMYSAGIDFTEKTEQGISSNIKSLSSNPLFTSAWENIKDLKSKNYIVGFNLNDFNDKKIGMISTFALGLCKESSYFGNGKISVNDIEAVPIAGPTQNSGYIPYLPTYWGITKYAQNSEGAAYFLKFLLDCDNLETDGMFYNSQFKQVFKIITDKRQNNLKPVIGRSVINYKEESKYSELCNLIVNSSSNSWDKALSDFEIDINQNIQQIVSK